MLTQVKTELQQYRIDNAAIPRGNMDGKGITGYGEFHVDICW
jgi:hypothetical protein